ncbi:P27 family phage terminase small subunit [Mycobacterium sp. MFM001]|uniref:P27 family phage terminase small subunit n=1 Tax=Mycobacterium sp. MFM001 TaxID=2049453 RepID=UPI000E2F7ABA|nr:P27 family phage terminase small subunit [Mycobacterium sp. MFM001]
MSKLSKQAVDPPRSLDPMAREVWDRQAARLWRDGRWHSIDHDLLCLFAETTALYLRLKADVDERGFLVTGRSDTVVRNPALTPLAQARADLLRIAKAIPLALPAVQADGFGAEVDRLLEELR